MLSALLGSLGAERVLLYLECYREGHASAIARTFGVGVSQIQRQLEKLESGGILVSRPVGTARVYTWNPRYPVLVELRALLRRALELQPPDETQKYFRERRRPRRTGKPF